MTSVFAEVELVYELSADLREVSPEKFSDAVRARIVADSDALATIPSNFLHLGRLSFASRTIILWSFDAVLVLSARSVKTSLTKSSVPECAECEVAPKIVCSGVRGV